MKQQCSNCRFFRQETRDKLEQERLKRMEAGLCCRHAPAAKLARHCDVAWKDTSWAQFPLVDDVAWCGDYEEQTGR